LGKSNVRYLLAGLTSFTIWGFFSIPLRHLNAFPAQEILYYRVFASLFFIWAAILIFRKKHLKSDLAYLRSISLKQKKSLVIQFIISTIFLTLNWFSFIYAVNNVSLTSAAFAYMVCPLFTALGGFILLKEELSGLKLISMVIALLSIVFLATGSTKEVLWSAGIAVFYAGYLVLQRKMQGLDKLNVLAVQIALSVLMILPFYFSQYQGLPQSSWFWFHIALIAVVFTIVPLFLNLYALIGLPSSTLGIMLYINPIISFVVAVLYFDELISAVQLYAYLLLLFSIFLFNWKAIKDIFTLKEKINN
jgi:chloramphenicol-sensitive protein RarD